MSWRSTQLNQELCNQDRVILDLFHHKDVNYIGNDNEFKRLLNHNNSSTNLILIINHNVWCSDIVKFLCQHLKHPINTFYIGLNRYCVKGNDTQEEYLNTGNHGNDLVLMINNVVAQLGYSVSKSGSYDKDLGRHFNFVQPLTWAYGSKANTSN
jgi:hypothetical protein